MNLIARVKQSLMGNTDQETYEYQCEVCHATFESTEANAGAVGCPSCGVPASGPPASRVRRLLSISRAPSAIERDRAEKLSSGYWLRSRTSLSLTLSTSSLRRV